MSQEIFPNINPNTTSGTQLAQMLNSFKSAMVSGMSGPNRPTQIQAGGIWVGTALLEESDIYTIYLYDGEKDIKLLDVYRDMGVATIENIVGNLKITNTADSSDGPVLALTKSRNGFQTKAGDVISEISSVGTTDDMKEVVQSQISVEAVEDVTTVRQGAVVRFKVTSPDSVGAVEVMRLFNGNLGVGDVEPTEKLHVLGNSLVENTDTPKNITHLNRPTGVLENDVVSVSEYKSTDALGESFVSTSFEVVANENHTDSERGTGFIFKAIKKGEAVLTEAFKYISGKFITEEMEVNTATITTANVTDANLQTIYLKSDWKIEVDEDNALVIARLEDDVWVTKQKLGGV